MCVVLYAVCTVVREHGYVSTNDEQAHGKKMWNFARILIFIAFAHNMRYENELRDKIRGPKQMSIHTGLYYFALGPACVGRWEMLFALHV